MGTAPTRKKCLTKLTFAANFKKKISIMNDIKRKASPGELLIKALRQDNRMLREENHRVNSELLKFQHALSCLNPSDETRQLHIKLLRLQQAVHALNELEHSIIEINSESDVLKLINEIMQTALEATDSSNGSLLLFDSETEELVFTEVIGSSREKLMGYRIAADEGIVGRSLTTEMPHLIKDVRMEEEWASEVDETVGFETYSVICAPLKHGKSRLGVIEMVNSYADGCFEKEDLDMLTLVARLASLAIVKFQALTD